MRYISISLIVGAAAMMGSSVQALPIAPDTSVATVGARTEQVRLVCNEWGRCWRTRSPRVVVQPGYSSYDYYSPSYGYYGPYGGSYGYYGGPGVSFGFGFGGHRHW